MVAMIGDGRPTSTPHLFVAGLGYVGERAGLHAIAHGWRVSGFCRTADKANMLRRRSGIDAYHLDLDDQYTGLSSEALEALSGASHLLMTVPPIAGRNRDPVLALHGHQVLNAVSSGRL